MSMDAKKTFTLTPESIALVAVVAASAMIVVKGYLYEATGASSFLASLLDSVMDVFLSGSTWLAVRWAAKPADANHRYGHGKIEALCGLFQAGLVGVASAFLAWHAGSMMAAPQPLQAGFFDIALAALILVTTSVLVLLQKKVLEETQSMAIRGDQAHYTSDIVINAGLLILLIINHFLSAPWIDALFTIIISMILLITVYEVGARALNTLLDHEVDETLRQRLILAVLRTDGVEGVHDFRAIETGTRIAIVMDIEVDSALSLIEAHDIARDAERSILAISPGAEIFIHVDPKGDIHDSRHMDLEPHHFT